MNAVLMGSVSSSVAALRGMLRGGLEIAGVLGLHNRHADRVSDYHDLEPIARQARIAYCAFDKVTDPQVYTFLRGRPFDWLFVIGLSQLIPKDIRNMPTAGAIGFHPTLLPEGRGRAPVAWTILLQRPAAANLFFLTDEPDAGDIIEQRPVPVLPDDYAADLIARTNDVLEQMFADLSPAFVSGQVPRVPQDPAKATYYARRRPEDGLINWSQPVEDIYRLIRAVSRPYPGAFTFVNGRKLIIWRAEPVDNNTISEKPGSVLDVRAGRPVVQTGRGLLLLTNMECEGEIALAAGQTLG